MHPSAYPHAFDQVSDPNAHATHFALKSRSTSSQIVTRWATAEDVRRFRGETRETVRARVAIKNGEVAAIAGYFVKGGLAHVFSEIRDNLPKTLIWREALTMMKRIDIPAVCVADRQIEGSCRFLERLGWRHVASVAEGEVYSWRT